MAFLQRLLGKPADGKVEKLRQLPALSALNDAELTQVAAAGELAVIPAGTVLLAEGEPARWCYLVLSGSVEATSGDGTHRRAGGAGDAIGDAEVVGRTPAPATVVALTDLVVLAIGCREFNGLLDICPGFCRAVRVSLSHRASEAWKPAPSPKPILRLVGGV